jgi:hypothetical protein
MFLQLMYIHVNEKILEKVPTSGQPVGGLLHFGEKATLLPIISAWTNN